MVEKQDIINLFGLDMIENQNIINLFGLDMIEKQDIINLRSYSSKNCVFVVLSDSKVTFRSEKKDVTFHPVLYVFCL